MSTQTTVAIAGITGTLAKLITKHLLSKPNVNIKGFCRNPSKLPTSLRTNPRLTIFEGTFNDTNLLRETVRSADVTICCYMGPDSLMIDGQKLLIDACIAEQVPRYIASDYCMDFRKLAFGDHPIKDAMKHVHAYLEEKKDVIKAVHILNACFLERPWVGVWDAEKGVLSYWGTGDEKWEFTSYDNSAEFTAEVAMDGNANGFLSFRGDHISMKEVAVVFKSVYKEEPKLQCLGSLEELYKTMHATRDRNPKDFYAWLGMWYTYYSINGQTTLPLPLDNSRFPDVKVVTVKDFFTGTEKKDIRKKSFF
ncbi:hypothetical protein G7Y89_g6920 [Cudoniella acicularis]|uniref:NAD(P)-binding domain-containing protein n=1 Tax=Cudoniella acicularis TaxID=354080 RepID=A0A8H4W2E9_9HELO|nr:hypothetical protein G7Y89_g6920 [Cudoniella acicularis]